MKCKSKGSSALHRNVATAPAHSWWFDVAMQRALLRNVINAFNADGYIEYLNISPGIEGLEELPHYGTINDFLFRTNTAYLKEIRTYMIKDLMEKDISMTMMFLLPRLFRINWMISGLYGVIFTGFFGLAFIET